MARYAARHGSPELIRALNESNAGMHPKVIAWLSKVGARRLMRQIQAGNHELSKPYMDARDPGHEKAVLSFSRLVGFAYGDNKENI